jgi:rsbT co-antagonist protein RsbR
MPAPNDAPRPLRLPAELYEDLLDGLHEGVFAIDAGIFRYVNAAMARMVGGVPADLVGQVFTDRIAPEDHDMVLTRYRRRLAGEDVADTYEFSLLHLDREQRIPVFMHTHTIPRDPVPLSVGTIVPLAMRSAVARVEQQTAALDLRADDSERLSIPVLQLHPHALVVPIVGHLNAGRARRLMDQLLAAIAGHGAREVIVDITGVPLVDERVAGYLVRTARAVRLLGARLTLAGLAPAIAQALVTLDIDLHELHSTRSLEDAWRAASARLAGKLG